MNPDARLAEVVAALEAVGLNCLIMGGHAARDYGVDRNTGDFDLHVAPECWDDLPHALGRSSLFAGRRRGCRSRLRTFCLASRTRRTCRP